MIGGSERVTLRVGEERSITLPAYGGASDWSHSVTGMSSAVSVEKLWTSRPYAEDDEERVGPPPARHMVYRLRGSAPGEAVVTFTAKGGDSRRVEVTVTP